MAEEPTVELASLDFRGRFMDNFGQLYNSEDNSDITIKVCNKRFHCHKLVLATQCDYFRAMFFGGMSESKTDVIEIDLPETPDKAFSAIVLFLYTGKITLTDFKIEVLLDILHLVDRYGLMDFQSGLCTFLISILDPENSIPIRDAAIRYRLDHLSEECEKYIDVNAGSLLKSKHFLTLTREEIMELLNRYAFRRSELVIFQAVCYWLDHNEDACPKQLVASVVRLPLIDRNSLLCVVWPTKHISDLAIIKALQNQLEEWTESEHYVEAFHRGVLVPEENVATLKYNSTVIKGGLKYQLFNGNENTSNGKNIPKIRRSAMLVNDESDPPTIRLGRPCIINTIQLSEELKGSIYISINNTEYVFLTKFESNSTKSFPSIVAQFIKIIEDKGTYLYKTFFECYHTTRAQ